MSNTILQIAPTPFFADRGCHIRIEGIVRSLTELGYENTVCTYHHGRDVAGVKTVRIKSIDNYTQTEAGPSKYKLWADWRLLWLAVKHYRQLKPTAIHAHLHEGVMIGLIVKILFFWRRTPLIADIQGSLTGELDTHGAFKKLPFLRWPTKQLERILLLCADHIVCSSTHSLSKIQSEFGIADKKLSLAQDGADPAPPLAESRRQTLLNKYGISNEKCLAVYSGALLNAKGLEELKQLILQCTHHTTLHFLIIGYPSENIQPFLQEHGLETGCTLTGQLPFEALPEHLSLADIAIDPKRSDAGEGSGKILNYLANGLAVVAFNTHNNADFLPEETQLADSVAEMTKQLVALSENKEHREHAGERNRQHFEQNYSWAVTKDQLKLVYDTI